MACKLIKYVIFILILILYITVILLVQLHFKGFTPLVTFTFQSIYNFQISLSLQVHSMYSKSLVNCIQYCDHSMKIKIFKV